MPGKNYPCAGRRSNATSVYQYPTGPARIQAAAGVQPHRSLDRSGPLGFQDLRKVVTRGVSGLTGGPRSAIFPSARQGVEECGLQSQNVVWEACS